MDRFKKTIKKAYRAWEKSHEFYVLKTEREAIFLDPVKLQEELKMAKEGKSRKVERM